VAAASPTVAAASPTVAAASPTVAAASPTVAAASPTVAAASPTVAAVAQAVGEQILFLRGGDLIAFTLSDGQTTTLAEQVTAFAATADGRRLAIVRGAGELWTINRDGSGSRQLTSNDRVESSLSWAPDGSALAYSAARTVQPAAPDWPSWSAWCAASEARILELDAAGAPVGGERTLGVGCEPSFGPDGRRIVYTAAPVLDTVQPGGVNNALIMVNRQGANGWRVAFAEGGEDGQLVYGAAWSPDAGQVSYQRFLGYQALVDINLTETGSSFQRNGAPVGHGAGWMLAPRYAPGGRLLAVTEHNYSDARGFSGYDIWTTRILRLGETSQVTLPSEELTLGAVEEARLPRASAAAWSPDGASLAVLLPAGWRAGADPMEALFPAATPGELWRWRPGAAPEALLATEVDYASPLLWLPALQ
jgi:hypothetical protein